MKRRRLPDHLAYSAKYKNRIIRAGKYRRPMTMAPLFMTDKARKAFYKQHKAKHPGTLYHWWKLQPDEMERDQVKTRFALDIYEPQPLLGLDDVQPPKTESEDV